MILVARAAVLAIIVMSTAEVESMIKFETIGVTIARAETHVVPIEETGQIGVSCTEQRIILDQTNSRHRTFVAVDQFVDERTLNARLRSQKVTFVQLDEDEMKRFFQIERHGGLIGNRFLDHHFDHRLRFVRYCDDMSENVRDELVVVVQCNAKFVLGYFASSAVERLRTDAKKISTRNLIADQHASSVVHAAVRLTGDRNQASRSSSIARTETDRPLSHRSNAERIRRTVATIRRLFTLRTGPMRWAMAKEARTVHIASALATVLTFQRAGMNDGRGLDRYHQLRSDAVDR